jgi:hypothetical protein
MLRFNPVLARTFLPGSAMVPLAERVMAPMRRSSTRIISNRRAIFVDTFSAQSLRVSVSWAFSLAMASFNLARRFELRSAWASLR